MADVFAIVLAGGEGKRLAPLTADRAKPAVPFGGNYRLVDFALSNLVNAGVRRIVVLTQYKSHSLDRHISTTWRLSPLLGNYVAPVPAQMRRGPHWFSGSADAIYQNLNLLHDERPDIVAVFGADHIYRMDPRQMVDQHIASGAAVTVAALRAPIEQADQFGVIETAADGQTISAFREKPKDAVGLPDAPDKVFASMGNYVFSTDALIEAVTADAASHSSSHDMGGNIVPMLVGVRLGARVRLLEATSVPGESERDRGYWRDVGTLDAFYDAHMDLISVHPVFNLYNQEWPILTWPDPLPPAKFVFEDEDRTGQALDSMVCAGVVISGATVRRSILSPGVHIHSYAEVEGSILFPGVDVARHAVVRNAILDKNVRVEEGAKIGVDLEERPQALRGLRRRRGRGRQGRDGGGDVKVSLLTREYPPEVYGGAGVHVEYLARELARLEELTVHCWGADREGAVAHRAWDALAGDAPHLAALRAMSIDLSMTAAVEGAELVHSHTWYANLAGHLAKLTYDIPHVATVHSLEPLRPWKAEQLGGGYALSSFCERIALEGADAVIAVSEGMRRDVLGAYPALDPARVRVIYNGIDAGEYAPDPRSDVLARYGVDPDRPSVVFVGRITRQKGVPYLVRAAHELDESAQLVLCAGAPDTPEIGAEVRELVESSAAPSAATSSGSRRCCPSPT